MNEKTQKYKEENYKDFGAQPDLLEIKLGCNLISLAEEEEDKRKTATCQARKQQARANPLRERRSYGRLS